MQTDEAERVATIVDRLHRAYPDAVLAGNLRVSALEQLPRSGVEGRHGVTPAGEEQRPVAPLGPLPERCRDRAGRVVVLGEAAVGAVGVERVLDLAPA